MTNSLTEERINISKLFDDQRRLSDAQINYVLYKWMHI
jgi:hypothetical protein